ncbi:MAG: twin-arginine translocation signal domain-containing protein, partial [Cyclobacteriaceae bacterium]|nr:twin-arginine translocation signal domain-containing protein [Cyclobacteriaceae bacterium]
MTTRRDFIKAASLTGVGMTILPSGVLFSKQKEEKVRIGLIGVGLRGQNHLDLLLRRADVEVVAI